jgi:hypothetical protein
MPEPYVLPRQPDVIDVVVQLRVEGHLWGGFSDYLYPVRNGVPKTLAEAKRLAGDFESLTSATLVVTTVTRSVEEHPIPLTTSPEVSAPVSTDSVS